MDELLDWAYSQTVGFLGAFFALMGNMGVELFDLPWVQAMVTFFNQLGWALFGVSLVVSGFEFGIEYSSGRGNLRHTAINCLKGFMAVSLFSTVPVRLYALSVSLQASFTAGITGLGSGIGDIGQSIVTRLTTPGGLIASGVDFICGKHHYGLNVRGIDDILFSDKRGIAGGCAPPMPRLWEAGLYPYRHPGREPGLPGPEAGGYVARCRAYLG